MARLRVLVPHPFRRGVDQFRNHHFDVILALQFQHSVIVAPVIFAGRILNRRPHEPVAENVDTHVCGSLVIALPVLLWWIRLAKINRAKRENRIGQHHFLCPHAKRQDKGYGHRGRRDSCHAFRPPIMVQRLILYPGKSKGSKAPRFCLIYTTVPELMFKIAADIYT